MPSEEFLLDPNRDSRVSITWEGYPVRRNIEVRVDEALVGRIESDDELRRGTNITLVDGSTLRLKLGTGEDAGELRVARNGVFLRSPEFFPTRSVKRASTASICFGAFITLFGIAGFLRGYGFGVSSTYSIIYVMFGVGLVILGVMTRNESFGATVAALVMVGLLALFFLYAGIIAVSRVLEEGVPVSYITGALTFQLVVLAILGLILYLNSRALQGIRRLEQLRREEPMLFTQTW